MAFSEKALLVKDYVMVHESENITAEDIANALNLGVRSVNATITAAFTNHKEETGEEVDGKPVKVVRPLMTRVAGELEIEDPDTGKVTHKAVKFIQMTSYGKTFVYKS